MVPWRLILSIALMFAELGPSKRGAAASTVRTSAESDDVPHQRVSSSSSTASSSSGEDPVDLQLSAFLAHATQKILAHETPTAGGSPLELVAARNEYEPLLVVLQSSSMPVDGVAVTVPGTTVEFRAFRVGYIDVVNITDCDSLGPGSFPDPLIPDVDSYVGQKRNAFPVTVPAGQNRLLLIDLFVPRGASPGVHAGQVTVTAAAAKRTMNFTLTVFGHTLPSTASMQSDYGMSQKSIFAGHKIESAMGTTAGQELYKRYLDAGLMHRISGGSDMQTAERFGDFEAQYDSFVNATGRTLPFGLSGAKLTAVRMPCDSLSSGGDHVHCPVFSPTNNSWANASSSWTRAVTGYWKELYQNFSRHGDGREQLLYDYSLDEPTSHCTDTDCHDHFAQIKARAAALHAVTPLLRSLVTTELCEFHMDAKGQCIVPSGMEDIKEDINLWVPHGDKSEHHVCLFFQTSRFSRFMVL